MKKQIVHVLSVLAVFACFAGVASAGIVGSQHDLTDWSGYGNYKGANDEVCIYCHTPHSALSQDRDGRRLPLWNRTLNENQNFTMYSNPGSFQGTMPADGKPTGFSLLCLSCHDGITSLGAVINHSAPGDIVFDPINANLSMTMPGWTDVNIGRDLSNDHPVSFVYDPALVTSDQTANGGVVGLATPNAATLAPLKLAPGSRLECTTCHEPHSNVNTPFLRMSNTGSAMCLKCHLK